MRKIFSSFLIPGVVVSVSGVGGASAFAEKAETLNEDLLHEEYFLSPGLLEDEKLYKKLLDAMQAQNEISRKYKVAERETP